MCLRDVPLNALARRKPIGLQKSSQSLRESARLVELEPGIEVFLRFGERGGRRRRRRGRRRWCSAGVGCGEHPREDKTKLAHQNSCEMPGAAERASDGFGRRWQCTRGDRVDDGCGRMYRASRAGAGRLEGRCRDHDRRRCDLQDETLPLRRRSCRRGASADDGDRDGDDDTSAPREAACIASLREEARHRKLHVAVDGGHGRGRTIADVHGRRGGGGGSEMATRCPGVSVASRRRERSSCRWADRRGCWPASPRRCDRAPDPRSGPTRRCAAAAS